jgi:hypothetical protein
VARILIVGGGCRALRLADRMHEAGHVVRITTRSDARRAEIEASGAECLIANPDRLATLRPVLEHATVVCWLLATASGESQAVEVLHGSRLEQFLRCLIDSAVRGVLYEAGGSALPKPVLTTGERIVLEVTRRNAIPARILRADPRDADRWVADACGAIEELLGCALSSNQ